MLRVRVFVILSLPLEVCLLVGGRDSGVGDALHSLLFCFFILVSEELTEVLKIIEALSLFSFISHMSEFPPTRYGVSFR